MSYPSLGSEARKKAIELVGGAALFLDQAGT